MAGMVRVCMLWVPSTVFTVVVLPDCCSPLLPHSSRSHTTSPPPHTHAPFPPTNTAIPQPPTAISFPQVAPSLLLVKDGGGAVFGAYVADAWRYNPRFYGTGETFVFQVCIVCMNVCACVCMCVQDCVCVMVEG